MDIIVTKIRCKSCAARGDVRHGWTRGPGGLIEPKMGRVVVHYASS